MKTLVLYFSQTGNTKTIAKAIHRGMSQVSDKCEIATIRDIDPRNIRDYDLVGLGSPIIGAEPDIVSRFIFSIPR